MKVTARATDQFTIPTGGRGQEGTTDRAWTAGASVKVELRLTKGFLDRVESTIDVLDPTPSTADQAVTAATATLLTGSLIAIPAGKLRIGTVLRWRGQVAKTAAGTAATTFHLRMGTAGTVADAIRCTFTLGVGTAAADEGFFEVTATVRGPLSASGIVEGVLVFKHNGNTAGLIAIPLAVVRSQSAAFDVTTAGLFASLSVTTGTTQAWTFRQMVAEAISLSP